MDIYHYDAATGVLLGTGQADPDPLEDGEFLIPAFATDIAPPAAADHNIRVFRDGAWGYIPEGAPETPTAPDPVVPVSVSARQFKLQLLAAGYLDQVNGWIATQSRAVQIAYEYSGTFVRSEPMMVAGFAAMGFTDAQIDDFFTAAAAL